MMIDKSIGFSMSGSNMCSEIVAWDLHNLVGVFNADHIISQSADYPMAPSSYGSDLISSTGYLQDVLFQFSKRRRLLINDQQISTSSHFDISAPEACWTPDLIQDFDTLSEITKCDRNSEMKTPEEAISEGYYDSSSSSHKESTDNYQWTPENGNLYCIDPISSSGCDKKRKTRLLAKVVYPFALVKPGGFEGDMTLNDINEKILMPPTRPVRHPVGDFAGRPLVSPDGPGLSGKAVVAFTRIHTQGSGTITIIRTRG